MYYQFRYRVYRPYPRKDGTVHQRHTFRKSFEADSLQEAWVLADEHIRCAHEDWPYIVRSVTRYKGWWNGRVVYKLKLTDDQEQELMRGALLKHERSIHFAKRPAH